MYFKSKMAACFNLENSEIPKGLLVLTIFAWYWITKDRLVLNDLSITSPHNEPQSVTELEKVYTEFLLEDLSSTLHMLHALHRDWQ